MSAVSFAGRPSQAMPNPRRRILVVDDDPQVLELISQYLELEGYEVMKAATGLEALTLAGEHLPDLVVLDLMLPGIDGLEVARRLRATSAVPILVLTGRTDEFDKLALFRAGVDDYITKPFLPRELVMRVQAIFRRLEAIGAPAIVYEDSVRVGDLVIHPRQREVLRAGQELELSPKEFDLLYFLASHPKQVFTREQLLEHVWHYDYYGDLRTVTVHMRRLRQKVEADPARPRHLRTVWGVGYKFEP